MTAASDAARPHRLWGLLIGLCLLAGCGEGPTSTNPTCAAATPLPLATVSDGVLTSDDAEFAGARIDYYALDLVDSATVDVWLTSREFDPLLFLFAAPGDVRLQAFDSLGAPPGDAEMASFRHRLGPGCHLIGASSWRDRARGDYTLRADTASSG